MKLYYLMIMSVLLSSCSIDESSIISDKDGDGLSDGFFGEVYEDRKSSTFYNLIGDLIFDSSSRATWYKGDEAIKLQSIWTPSYEKQLIKDGVTYQWEVTSFNKKYSIYQKMRADNPTLGTDTYVVMIVEAIPIFDENPAVLLISKDPVFSGIAEAKAYADNNLIPELSISVPFLDLVFDPDTLVIEDHNMVEHLAAITAKYKLLEIFGSKTYINKKELLEPYGYHILLN